MSAEPRTRDAPRGLLALYDLVLPAVYGYFARRCHDRGTAEDLTSETFLAAMDSARKEDPPDISVPWLIGVARPKLADHHRHRRHSDVSVADMREPDASDDWDAELDRIVAESALARLSGPHRAVLKLGMPLAVYRPEADQPRPQLNGFGPGELSYVTYEVGDSSAFRDFYGRVLGWVFEPGRIDDGWQITDAHPWPAVAPNRRLSRCGPSPTSRMRSPGFARRAAPSSRSRRGSSMA